MDICLILSEYSYYPMTYVNVFEYDEFYDQEILKLTIRFTQYGYSLASEYGVIIADSFNQMLHLFKLQSCPEMIVEPVINYAVK